MNDNPQYVIAAIRTQFVPITISDGKLEAVGFNGWPEYLANQARQKLEKYKGESQTSSKRQ